LRDVLCGATTVAVPQLLLCHNWRCKAYHAKKITNGLVVKYMTSPTPNETDDS
jgi:hypothetical protein